MVVNGTAVNDRSFFFLSCWNCINSFCGIWHTKTSINWFIWFIYKLHHAIMSTYPADQNTKFVSINYNVGTNLFRVWVDVTMSGLKDHLDQINRWLNDIDKRSVNNVGYHRPSIDLDRSVQFTWWSLRTRTKWDIVCVLLCCFTLLNYVVGIMFNVCCCCCCCVLVVHSCLNNDFLWNSCLATLPGN